jgi:dihydroorotate dehydrogenase electron transfer subunit
MLDRRVKLKKVKPLGAANYLLTLDAPEQARLVNPGQFVMVKCCEELGADPLLRRPFSVFAVHGRDRTGSPAALDILVKEVGLGTSKLVRMWPGQELSVLGPQGNPFQLSGDLAGRLQSACLVAGGVGIAALYLLARKLLSCGVAPVLFYGARTAEELVLREYFERLGIEIHYTTEDGTMGNRGMVTAPLARFLRENAPEGLKIFTCGPWAMMRAVHTLAFEHSVPCDASLEARMGCSLGACMGCVVQTSGPGTTPRFIRVCIEGPIMDSRRIDWEHPPI